MASTTTDDPTTTEDAPPINFTVKTTKDEKYTLSLPHSTPISELKSKLHELADISPGLQRLIYSGKVMKDDQTLGFYKVQSGHTIHLVKGAASNQRVVQGQPAGAASSSGAGVQAPIIPRIAAGVGNNPLAGLTGARYAGLAPLPNADIFGADGGMGAPPDPDQMYEMMSAPGFQASMDAMLQNPAVIDYIIQSNPTLSQIPGAREMMRSPEFRRMMTDPDMLRQASEMQRRLGLGGRVPNFPAPGITETTPVQQQQQQQQHQHQHQHQQQGQGQEGQGQIPPQQQEANPLAAGNPFAALFASPATRGQQQSLPLPGFAYPELASLLGVSPQSPSAPTPGQPDSTTSPPTQSTNTHLPAMRALDLQALSELFRAPGSSSDNPGGLPFPPALLQMLGLSGNTAGPPTVDNRPPEERYAEQLRQLNDMGFFDFDRNVEALRRSGGSVQGAVQHLLGD